MISWFDFRVRSYVGARGFSPVSQWVAGVLAGAVLENDIRLRRTIFRPGGLNDIREPGLANGELIQLFHNWISSWGRVVRKREGGEYWAS